jgi:hypothetical protein
MTEDPSQIPQKSRDSDKASLENKKNASLVLLVAAWFIPFLWPFAIAGTIAMFPKTSKKVGIGALSLTALAIFAVVANGAFQSNDKKNQEDLGSTSQVVEERPTRNVELNINGKRIADRLEEECDYWGIDRYNRDGTATISKSIYTTWGGKEVMMIPRASWNALSSSERSALARYVSQERGVTSIIVGEVRPSDKYDRNTITVDETVWP